MAQYSVHSMLVSLNIQDTPLRYSPSVGPPINFTVTYNQKESQQLPIFSYSNLGPKWTFNWLSYITDDPNSQLPLTSVYVPGGGEEIHRFDFKTLAFVPDPQTHALLVRPNPNNPNLYERRFPDGSKHVFAKSNGSTSYPRKLFMTQVIDPAGHAVTLTYDANFRITKITDALSQETLLYYDLPDDHLKITKVRDPFLRVATFEYEDGKLQKITDIIEIESVFAYTPGTDSIEWLTTPYGATHFESGANGTSRWIDITDPLGGKERVEYQDQGGTPANDTVAPNASGIVNAGLDVANTFYWDKKALSMHPPVEGVYLYTKSRIKHWLYNADGTVSGILSSERKPLENRVWYTYDGQPDYQHIGSNAKPSQVARVLADGTTQLSRFEYYNSFGKATKATDPVGRVISYIYDSNQIDLLETRQTRGANNELLRKLTYNSQHRPLTDTDAAGQTTTYTYNSAGQVETIANAKGEVTSIAYGGSVPPGCIESISSTPFGNFNSSFGFTYDEFNRVETVINDDDQYTVTMEYDDLDRKTKVTYPDATYEQFKYRDNLTDAMTLDLTGTRDRLGRWTYRQYNANRQMISITDPAQRTTQYDWCNCGTLTKITDPKLQPTTFHHDLQGRIHQKVFANSSTINYLYEGQTGPHTVGATSRLKWSTDAMNRRTNYAYFPDDNISSVVYSDIALAITGTPSVNYTYDANYNRIATMTDGTGQTLYLYNPITAPPALGAGKLAAVDGPLVNDTIAFTYDQLGRPLSESINGVAETVAYDSLGRVTTTNNALGNFTRVYQGVTPRLQTLTYPNGQTANYTYFGNNDDRRLQTLQNRAGGSVNLSKFDYTYNDEGEIQSWSSLLGMSTSGRWFGYDPAGQLLHARNNANPAVATQRIDYGYDVGANRTSDRTYNPQGSANNGTLNSYPAQANYLNQLDSLTTTINGFGGSPTPLVHDLAGNVTTDALGRTLEWDHEDRLVAINYTGTTNRSEFTYDGLSRRVKIVEKTGATVTSTKRFVWIGSRIAQERDANNVNTRLYFSDGERRGIGGLMQSYYYTRDHLGSIREMTNSAGAVQVRYEYDPYGKRTKLSGAFDVDFGYTGHYHHAPSGMNLTLYRAYSPIFGRWLSRDPIAEAGGLNLYRYVENNPTSLVDPLGLLVDVYFNIVQGLITVIDRDTRAIWTARAHAGSGPYLNDPASTHIREHTDRQGNLVGGPTPVGEYNILNDREGRVWYELDMMDNIPGNDRNDSGPMRSLLRLHPGPDSTGCPTVPDPGDYERIRNIIENTRTTAFQDANGVARTRYGTMHVFSSAVPRAVFP